MARVMKPPLPASSLSGRGPPRFPKPARKFPARFMTRRPTVAGFAAQSRRASPRGGAFAAADSKGVSGRADPPTLNSPGITATQSSGPEAARRPRQPRKSRRGVPGPRPTRSGPAPACAASPLDSAPSPCSTLRGNRAGRGGQDVIAADVPMALIVPMALDGTQGQCFGIRAGLRTPAYPSHCSISRCSIPDVE